MPDTDQRSMNEWEKFKFFVLPCICGLEQQWHTVSVLCRNVLRCNGVSHVLTPTIITKKDMVDRH